MLLRPGGGVYYPESPSAPQTPLPVDCAIPLRPAGAGPVVLTLPQMFGARVYFVRDSKLSFCVNPGPALVEPAFATPSDANYGRTWSFAGFTFNPQQLYANISYAPPISGSTCRAGGAYAPGTSAAASYAFPYDDVRPDGQPDVSGAAHDGNPRRFTVTVGSRGAGLDCPRAPDRSGTPEARAPVGAPPPTPWRAWGDPHRTPRLKLPQTSSGGTPTRLEARKRLKSELDGAMVDLVEA